VDRFFPNPFASTQKLEAAIKQLPRHLYTMFQRVTKNEIEDIIKSTKSWKALKKNNIFTELFKACGKFLHKILTALVISSFNAAYFFHRFKIAKITVLPKSNKTIAQKATSGAWRPISLLNIIRKIVEAAFVRRITNVAKAKHFVTAPAWTLLLVT
jgi:hypothetical protein